MTNAFSTSLLREKFVLHDEVPFQGKSPENLVATSNRVIMPLVWKHQDYEETFVIRGQNMHCVTRMAATLAREFQIRGPITNRDKAVDWAELWKQSHSDFERRYNPDNWIAIYYGGKPVYSTGDQPFLDLIEKCDAENEGAYDDAVKIAENAFRKTGKNVAIEHFSTMGLIVNVEKSKGRCGIIMRGPARTATFNFTAQGDHDRPVDTPRCLNICSAFLEGINLGFMIGKIKDDLRMGKIGRDSEKVLYMEDGKKRIGRLNAEITFFEKNHKVYYRPERPDFLEIMQQAETKLAKEHEAAMGLS